mmetsp:Transcript_13070/g.52666  ORF Transcript_13070/g.52666 Transcript_13070/m.52666 type:complete len:236 (+) Transcript_13070:628-1335(+)
MGGMGKTTTTRVPASETIAVAVEAASSGCSRLAGAGTTPTAASGASPCTTSAGSSPRTGTPTGSGAGAARTTRSSSDASPLDCGSSESLVATLRIWNAERRRWTPSWRRSTRDARGARRRRSAGCCGATRRGTGGDATVWWTRGTRSSRNEPSASATIYTTTQPRRMIFGASAWSSSCWRGSRTSSCASSAGFPRARTGSPCISTGAPRSGPKRRAKKSARPTPRLTRGAGHWKP